MQPSASPGKVAPALEAVGVFVLVAAARLVYLAATGVTYEDAYISLRYAENLARGTGLVYNVGEPVFGASTPLYVLLLAGLARLGAPEPLLAARVLIALADGATATLWARLLRREFRAPSAALLFVVLFGLSPFLVETAVSGMETSLAVLFLTAAILADRAGRDWLAGGCLGLLVMTRPDGLLPAALLLGLRAWRERKAPWRSAAVLALTLLPWVIGATFYYGTPLPHSLSAKAVAYNLHRPFLWPNLRTTVGHFAPTAGSWPQRGVNVWLLPLLLAGVGWWWSRPPSGRIVPLLFLAWWAYLVLPRTLLFRWYFPPLLLPVYLMAAAGLGRWADEGWEEWRWLPRLLPALLAVWLLAWLRISAGQARQIQAAEDGVRRAIGSWLATHTPPDARVATEPIGYIGYFSRRTILDEVGLVSPQYVPLNLAGAGWFAESLRRFRPDYVVERPFYVRTNRTINTEVPMFRSEAERAEFFAWYEPLLHYASREAPGRLHRDYEFIIYRRRFEGRRDKEWRK